MVRAMLVTCIRNFRRSRGPVSGLLSAPSSSPVRPSRPPPPPVRRWRPPRRAHGGWLPMRRPFARRRRATPAPSLVLHGYCSYCRPDAPSFLSPPWIWMVRLHLLHSFLVRGERINERMQYLQWLVPGCSKVTGKASMLDEIINYVKSVEKKVEFLSIKYRRLPLPTCNHRPHAACPVSSTMLLSAMARLSIKPCLTMNGIAACNIFSQNLFSGSDAEFHSAESVPSYRF